jgi:cell division protein FtsB
MKSLWGQGTRYLRVRRAVDMSPGLARGLLVALLVLIGLVFLVGDVGLVRLWSTQRQMKSLRAKIEELEHRNALLAVEIEQLRSDTFTIEKVAREKYGYLRPGDKVYRIITVPEDLGKTASAPRTVDRRGGKQ